VAGNAAVSSPNIYGPFAVDTDNLTSGDPLLRPLGNYGGLTQTRPPLSGSPAVDGGGATCPNAPATGMPLAVDQIGTTRPQGPRCDIGATEYVPVSPSLGNVPPVGTAGQAITLTGTGFQRTTSVTVDGVAATGIAVNADGTRLTLVLPAHAPGTVPFVVANPGAGNSVTTTITYVTPNAAPMPTRAVPTAVVPPTGATATPLPAAGGPARAVPTLPAPPAGATATPLPLPAPPRR